MPHPAGRTLLYWLAKAAQQQRLDARATTERVGDLAGVRAVTIDRFEKGSHWPRDPDRLVVAYATINGLDDPRDLYQHALDMWRQHGIAPTLDEQDASPGEAWKLDPPPVPQDQPAPERKSTSKRTRRANS